MPRAVRYCGCSSVRVCTSVPIVHFLRSRTHIANLALPMSLHYWKTIPQAICCYPFNADGIIPPLCRVSIGCYTDSSDLLWECIAFRRCTKCFKNVHQHMKNALNPRLFIKNINNLGISFTKKPSAKRFHLSYAFLQSRQPSILESAEQRSRATCEASPTIWRWSSAYAMDSLLIWLALPYREMTF